jgi:hypothetical protein
MQPEPPGRFCGEEAEVSGNSFPAGDAGNSTRSIDNSERETPSPQDAVCHALSDCKRRLLAGLPRVTVFVSPPVENWKGGIDDPFVDPASQPVLYGYTCEPNYAPPAQLPRSTGLPSARDSLGPPTAPPGSESD